MKNLLYLCLFGLIVLASCVSEKKEVPIGTYYGVLPCADCPGISYELTLENDSSYIEKMIYQDRSSEVSQHKGNFVMDADGMITLSDKHSSDGTRQFKVNEEGILMLDKSGNPIEGSTAALYQLRSSKPENFNMKLKEKSFVGFKASGNEPFWSVEMDFHKNITFKPMEGEPITVPLTKPVRPQDVNAVTYRAETEKGSLQVTIFKEPCQDTMSGKEFGHRVTVRVKVGDEQEYKEYSGCGDYQGDYRLNDIWVLESINGEVFMKEGKSPNLEFNLMENRFYGFGGCNRINGNITLENQKVTFGKVVSTQMACPNLEKEGVFLKKLNDQTYDFIISEGRLTLSNEEDELVFKKID
ncbi:copper resistance protein NlpE N-terminal domain-containing protein [Echinicola sp. CAU 1574]|uniref:Copper resistance protein NlpE N-terminal domain-containing protein n=1 Tax=Echinicola arenosa TaxID=2774144 RepID=A0ABR9AJP3_9BACT|nr:copper resistance protein NlpE N-terminal domain-containing protein [Echinicola arenosa]MBD8488754.1 copper resistance protein NlpE N-terminal domain-containing protein [Echinicola arenosa]